MIKIIFDDKMEKYFSNIFNTDIRKIILDSNSYDITSELCNFISDLIARRQLPTAKCPYRHIKESKTLEIYGIDDYVERTRFYLDYLERRK